MSSDSPQVSPLSIVFMFVTLLICIGLPVGLVIWGKARYKKAFSLIPLLAGALGFFISQVVFRIPAVQLLLPSFSWYQQFMKMQWPYLIFMCFTAGLVEEPARFIAFSIMKKRRSYPDGLSYGIGHGGIEAVIIVGLSYLGNIVLSFMINSGMPGLPASILPAAAITALAGTPPYMFLIAGVERIFAVTLHIALSLVVLKGFQANKKALYLVISFLLHGTANFITLTAMQIGASAVPGDPQAGGILFSEGALLIVAVLSVLYIVKQAKEWRRLKTDEQLQPLA